jgi:O-acetyl-ADP-ribose deacetylase (regulator of RNase III)
MTEPLLSAQIKGRRLDVLVADITTLDVDAIVNAANRSLLGGGGVDGAIHRAAGPGLQPALDRFGGCPTGDCRVTPGFGLKARTIIHCVGPVWRGGSAGEAELLASCYRRALEEAARAGLRSIAFPAISTGIYGYPPEEAAAVALAAVREALSDPVVGKGISEVRFVCFDASTAALYRGRLRPA